MYSSFAMKSDVDHICVPQKLGGRGIISVIVAVEHEKWNLFS